MHSFSSNSKLLTLLFACISVSTELLLDEIIDSKYNKQNVRIIGGENATNGEFPFMVSLQIQPSFGPRYHYCGGTILNASIILTAGHCVYGRDPRQIQVVAGANNLSDPDEPNQQRRNVHAIAIATDFDFALITLTQNFVLNEYVQEAHQPPPNTEPPSEINCTLIGWGSTLKPLSIPSSDTQLLEKVNMAIVPSPECQTIYQHILPFNSTTTICARGTDSNKSQGPCTGDSGGPLICPLNGNEGPWVVGGVMSQSMIPCADPSWPSIFTNLYKVGDYATKKYFAANQIHF